MPEFKRSNLARSDVNTTLDSHIFQDERCLVLIDKTYFVLGKNAAGYHPGPAAPSTTDSCKMAT